MWWCTYTWTFVHSHHTHTSIKVAGEVCALDGIQSGSITLQWWPLVPYCSVIIKILEEAVLHILTCRGTSYRAFAHILGSFVIIFVRRDERMHAIRVESFWCSSSGRKPPNFPRLLVRKLGFRCKYFDICYNKLTVRTLWLTVVLLCRMGRAQIPQQKREDGRTTKRYLLTYTTVHSIVFAKFHLTAKRTSHPSLVESSQNSSPKGPCIRHHARAIIWTRLCGRTPKFIFEEDKTNPRNP